MRADVGFVGALVAKGLVLAAFEQSAPWVILLGAGCLTLGMLGLVVGGFDGRGSRRDCGHGGQEGDKGQGNDNGEFHIEAVLLFCVLYVVMCDRRKKGGEGEKYLGAFLSFFFHCRPP